MELERMRMEMRKRAWRWETRWEGDIDGGWRWDVGHGL